MASCGTLELLWAAVAKYGRELPIKVRIAKTIPVGSWSGVNSKICFIYLPCSTASAVPRRVTPAIIRPCDIFDISCKDHVARSFLITVMLSAKLLPTRFW